MKYILEPTDFAEVCLFPESVLTNTSVILTKVKKHILKTEWSGSADTHISLYSYGNFWHVLVCNIVAKYKSIKYRYILAKKRMFIP